jgi:hypothetical protein
MSKSFIHYSTVTVYGMENCGDRWVNSWKKKSGKFQIVSEVEITEILQETKSTRSSEYSSDCQDEPGIQLNLVCVANSVSSLALRSAQINSSTSPSMAA